MRQKFFLFIVFALFASCSSDSGEESSSTKVNPPTGKADSFAATRQFEVILTNPHCDECTSEDKNHLLERSQIIARVVELIESAKTSIDVAQFTFSRREIEAALLAAHERGVKVRIAMDFKQSEQSDNVSNRLKDAGLAVRFIKGKANSSFNGLQHAKFMMVDGDILLTGSNNWSSTGTSINNENTIILRSDAQDPMVGAFQCYFDAMFDSIFQESAECSSDEVKFTPGTRAFGMMKEDLRAANRSVDVLMHHLVFDDAVKLLAQTAERGVRVRVLVNAADREEIKGSRWDRFFAAGGEVRFKKTNADAFQIMHHKLAVVDDKILINGSGNWSGSAFFNNYEFYVRYTQPEVVSPFVSAFDRLWAWSFDAESLDSGITAAEQDAAQRQHYFGNLHAHFDLKDGEKFMDDGVLEREVDGEAVDVSAEANGDPILHALEYARDRGGLDFIALTPHVQDDNPADSNNIANMNAAAYGQMLSTINSINESSAGEFVALEGMEWSTNSTGNHLNIFGATELAKVERGDFETLYEGYLVAQSETGARPFIMFNHPRTFRNHDLLLGQWDQIFGVNLLDIENNSDRNKKFNDFGLDDYEPLRSVRDSWIAGEAMPDEAVVQETMQTIVRVTEPYARLMEVTVARGSELASETPVNPSMTEDPETGAIGRFAKVHTDYDYYLRSGFKIAPVANHDNHRANWGTGHTTRTVAVAETLSRDAILEAIDQRAIYASEDENTAVWFYADDRVRQGSEMVTISDRVNIRFRVVDPDVAGDFLVNVYVGTVGGDEVTIQQSFDVEAGAWTEQLIALPGEGDHFIYLELHERSQDRMTWSAPIFVEAQ